MRLSRSFYPEWNQRGGEPDFRRLLLVAFVATAVGAISSSAVIASLTDTPAPKSGVLPISARAIVVSAKSSAAASAAGDQTAMATTLPSTAATSIASAVSGPSAAATEAASRRHVPSGRERRRERRTGARPSRLDWRRLAHAPLSFSSSILNER